MRTITITVLMSGETVVQTTGFSGQDCKDATKAFEKALGIVLADKPNFDQMVGEQVENRAR